MAYPCALYIGQTLRGATLVCTMLIVSITPAVADTVAIVSICAKAEKRCNETTARSVYRIPVQGQICFVPIQQRLAEMGVYDETQDDIKITCESKPAG